MIKTLDDLPSVALYLRRVGATAVNFKSATVTEVVNNYPKVTGWVGFSPGGHVNVSGEVDGPTPAEQEAILLEFASAEMPKPVTLAAIADAPPGCDLNDRNTFICHDFNDQIVMIHQRYETPTGKGFLPWTRWSDGQWRKMEPEVMPFFGLPGAKEHSTLFLHEGSKSAARVKRAVAGEDDSFPWTENMKWGHHIGWIGGVFALERSDWERLAKMGWKKVIVVADNDAGGRRIVPRIAEKFNCPVFSVVFTDSWPEHFDCGDEWPKEMFGDAGQYIGPAYEDCLQPATWATDEHIIPPETPRGRERREHTIRPVFAEQWAWVEKVDQMVNIEMPQYKMNSSHFNGFIRPFSHVKETMQVFLREWSGNQMELTYDPSNDGSRVRTPAGLQAINLYRPPSIKPVSGDYAPWIEFMEYLIPNDEDRAHVLRWIATLRAKPATRMLYGILLMSERQGIGKGTLGRILADLIGRHNTSFPGESMIVNSEFNGWLSGKRLIVVDEIYSGHSWKAYNKLKPYVSDESIEVNVKFEATWTMPNWTHYLLMSNSRAALKLEVTDRRWLVPEVAERPWSMDRFHAFNDWLKGGGIAHIAYWAHTFEKRGEGRYVRAGETAPMSANKSRLIEESRSDGEQLFLSFADEMKERKQPTAVVLPVIKAWAVAKLEDKVFETPQAIGRILRNAGLFITNERVKIAGQKQFLVVNQEVMTHWSAGQLREALALPSAIIPDDF